MAATDDMSRALSSPSRRSFLQLAGLGVAGIGGLAGLAACSSSGSPHAAGSGTPAGTGVAPAGHWSASLQLDWIKNIQFAGEYFADSKGYFTAAGFDKLALIAGGAASTSPEAMVLTKKVQLALTSPITTAAAIADQGAPLKVIAAEYQKAPFCIVSVEEKTPIRTIADLKGKKIGIQTGTNEAIWKGFLKINNVSSSDLTQVPVLYDPTVVTNGTVDGFMAYVTNEPVLLKSEGFHPVSLMFADNGMELFTDAVIVTEDMIKTQRDMLKAFLKADIQGWKAAIADPGGAANLAANVYGKDQKLQVGEQTQEATIQNTLIATTETKANGLLTMSQRLVDQTVKSLQAMGTKITADQLVDTSLIAEVYRENPSLLSG